ncbi:MAG: TonB C-terminal domain-containing protein [Deltaproteobacteria bacterium]|nr:MAG: TonB C-terminal domain-containing protein [Deltaproteobacteria bacterium]
MKLIGPNGLTAPHSMIISEWRKPFNISIGLHIIVLVLAMLAPSLFDRKPKLPEIYTVNLFTATEVAGPEAPAPKAPAPKAAAKPAVKKIEPATKKPVVSIKPSKPEVAPAVKTISKPVSLKPLKQKVKVGKTKEEEAKDKAKLSRVVQRLKATAAQKEAEEVADEAAKDAVSKLADALKTTTGTATRATGKTTSAAKSTGISGPRGTGIEPDFYMKQYLSAVYQKIHDHWVLPDLQNWDNSLEAVLVITIMKDGTVTKSFFERKSNNIYFNQFVLKALKDASPLPPFPDQLKENSFELGLRFKPGELY